MTGRVGALARVLLTCLRDPAARRARIDVVTTLYRRDGLRGVVDAIAHGRGARRPA